MNVPGLLAASTVRKVVEVVDVDGVVRRIDVNEVVERIDVDHVIRRIDIDAAIRRIDIDAAIRRIDINRAVQTIDLNDLLSKVDWNTTIVDKLDFDALLHKIDTNSIVLRSSTGAVGAFLDTLRTHVVLLDLYLWVVTRGKFLTRRTRQLCYLPPKPGAAIVVVDNDPNSNSSSDGASSQQQQRQQQQRQRQRQRDDLTLYPKGRTRKAEAVQGRYVGFVTKVLAMLVDTLTVSTLFGLLFRFIEWCLMLFLGNSAKEAHDTSQGYKTNNMLVMLVVYWAVYWFGYFFLCTWLTGQTVGMVVLGCKVVNAHDSPWSWLHPRRRRQRQRRGHHDPQIHADSNNVVTARQAFWRTLLLPVTLTLCPPLCVMGMYRRDGRMLHDWLAGTGMIYMWDARLARMRHAAEVQDENKRNNDGDIAGGSSFVTEGSDEFDEWLDEEDNSSHHGSDDDEYPSTTGSTTNNGQGQEVTLGAEPLLRRTAGQRHIGNDNNNKDGKAVGFVPPKHAGNREDYETFNGK